MHSSSDDALGRDPLTRPRPPKAEPEIIPPGAEPSSRPRLEPHAFADRGIRIQVTRPGPLGIAVILLAAVLIAALSLLIVTGAALIGAVAVGLSIAAAFVSRLFRGKLR